jgi:hypothetical protein
MPCANSQLLFVEIIPGADLEQKVLKLINNWLNKNKFLVKIQYFQNGSKAEKRETSLL